MKKFSPPLPLPLPSVKQVLWRSGCPPEQAGPEVEHEAELALKALSSLESAWCGSVYLEPGETPPSISTVFPGKPLSIMAVTLGDKYEALLADAGDFSRFMIDSAASVAVESFMKKLQIFLADALEMTPTKRAAPGYGSIPLSIQPEIIGMFPDSGIVCTEDYMLSPVKSMTGVVGWIQREN